MNRIKYIFILTTLILTISCGQNKIQNEKSETKDSNIISCDSFPTVKNLQENQESENKTIIKFEEFTITIDKFGVYDEENKLSQVQSDTVYISADMGETIENHKIKIETNVLENLNIEQCYETSLTIMNEGPHRDLTEWKHFTSDWKTLKQENGKFLCLSYSEKETEKFPEISIEEVKAEVKVECGEKWAKHIENVTSVTEYPCGVGISRYFLRITGKLKTNGTKISKLIIIESLMGC